MAVEYFVRFLSTGILEASVSRTLRASKRSQSLGHIAGSNQVNVRSKRETLARSTMKNGWILQVKAHCNRPLLRLFDIVLHLEVLPSALFKAFLTAPRTLATPYRHHKSCALSVLKLDEPPDRFVDGSNVLHIQDLSTYEVKSVPKAYGRAEDLS